MMVVSSEQAVARDDVTVKMDAQTIRKAKMVAAARGITLAEYLSSIVAPIVDRDLERETKRVLEIGPRLETRAKKSRGKGDEGPAGK
jgi:hypothetical protein